MHARFGVFYVNCAYMCMETTKYTGKSNLTVNTVASHCSVGPTLVQVTNMHVFYHVQITFTTSGQPHIIVDYS